MDSDAAKKYRQQIMFNTEDDVHFPTLTVNRTMKFALRNKIPQDRENGSGKKEFVQQHRDGILDSLGIPHTKKTLVGNEFVRGVSGGERKRVSLAELMAGQVGASIRIHLSSSNCIQSPVQFWDNPTRGLDSKTAYEFAKMLRRESDESSKTMVATMYQAGNDIYNQFDKILVLAEGLVTYYGPRSQARAYFEDLGFICPKGANIADFLTSVTVLTERVVAPGMEEKVPNTPQEFEARYRASSIYQDARDSIVAPEKLGSEEEDLAAAVLREKKRRHIPRPQSVYTTGLWDQVIACVIR